MRFLSTTTKSVFVGPTKSKPCIQFAPKVGTILKEFGKKNGSCPSKRGRFVL